MSVFAHFLNAIRDYKSRLVAFQYVSGAHSSENLAGELEVIARGWNFSHKVGVGVCDNTSNNDTCLEAFFNKVKPFMDERDVAVRRLRYFGYILNLAAQAFLFGSSGAFELEVDALEQLQ